MRPGGRWSNEYVVAPLLDFVGKNLREDAPGTSYSHWSPHVTNVVYVPQDLDGTAYAYPLKRRYDETNMTLDGLESPCATDRKHLFEPEEDHPGFDEANWREGDDGREHAEGGLDDGEAQPDPRSDHRTSSKRSPFLQLYALEESAG